MPLLRGVEFITKKAIPNGKALKEIYHPYYQAASCHSFIALLKASE